MAPSADVLALLARYPRQGTVKTRLARCLGDAAACALYGAFLRDLDQRLSGHDWDVHWLYTPRDSPLPAWLGPGRAGSAQVGETLNARLLDGARRLLRRYARVILMGTDSPHLPPAWAARGFALLADHDVVLGPCDDGGYYLVGLRRPHDIFSGIAMSTPTVLAETIALAERQGLSVALLPRTFDIDDECGLAALRRWLAADASAGALPRTRAALGRLGEPAAEREAAG